MIKLVFVKSSLKHQDFPGGPAVKKTPSSAGDAGSITGRSLESRILQGN